MDMPIRAAVTAVFAIVLSCAFVPASHAAMGLRCSDWLNARAHVRYDARTNQYIQINPKNARPVPPDVDEKSAYLTYYLTGIVETFMHLDPQLEKIAEIPGVKMPPRITLQALFERVEEVCRGGLERERRDYDVLDVVSINNMSNVTLRVLLIHELTDKFMEAGRRGATQR
jgi:hypothetical protein